MSKKSPSRLHLVALLALLSACAYKMPIQQGNYLDPETIAKVKPGMTRTQVRYLLGTPIVPGAFNQDRWDYDYYLRFRRVRQPVRAHATVWFANDHVDRVESTTKAAPPVPVSNRNANAPGS